ncbi:tetratricopeptide repeat protein [Kordiimonas marina]|uniref:tetratricopeptide repeat protein n=1 Tax=Kordiimonas marina TaxID=2872312 RepID=UPI001FF66F60|nr:tetratricopeptide repeat protein [Kordiimonas marina]MCJ9427609.1 tetratricopeptide repeat protein [Kordiimonas marina]
MKVRAWALSVLMAALMVPAFGTPADAKSRSDQLAEQVAQLTRQVQSLQRKVFGVDASGNVSAPTQPAAVSSNDRQVLADLSAQIGALSHQIRTLTGRMEQVEYQQRQFEDALDLLKKQIMLQQNQMDTVQAAGKVAQPAGTPAASTTPAPATAEAPKPAAPAVELPEGDAAKQYQYAFAFIQKNDLESGRIAMEKFLAVNKDEKLAGNAKFWLGRIYMLQGKMAQAAQQFLGLIEKHPNHEKRVDALVDLSEVLIKLGSASDACNALAEFRRSEAKANDRLKDRAADLAKEAKCS